MLQSKLSTVRKLTVAQSKLTKLALAKIAVVAAAAVDTAAAAVVVVAAEAVTNPASIQLF